MAQLPLWKRLGARLRTWADRRRSRLRTDVLPGLAWIVAVSAFVVGGYFLTYQVFFAQLPFEDITSARRGGTEERFRYDGVVYFHGARVGADAVELDYLSTRILDSAEDKRLELFIRLDEAEALSDVHASPGTLRIEHILLEGGRRKEKETKRIEDRVVLSRDALQRHLIPWPTDRKGLNRLRIWFEPVEAESVPDVLFATNITGVSNWGTIIGLGLLGALAVVVRLVLRRGRGLMGTLVGLVVVSLCVFFSSGAFVSNAYVQFSDSSVTRATPRAADLLRGETPTNMYRSIGYVVVPALVLKIEGPSVVLRNIRHFYSTFPTARYIMFAGFLIALVILLRAIEVCLNHWIALLFGMLVSVFYPFMHDLSNVEDDACLIPLMMVFTAYALRQAYRAGRHQHAVWGMAAVFFVMMLTKVTAAVLLPLTPLALAASAWRRRSGWTAPLLAAALMFTAFIGGRGLASVGPREVVPGEPYAGSVLWETLWAANGIYDHHSAHWFTKSGPLRSRRVAEATDLPESPSHLRHSTTATEELYKPKVKEALRERPGYFWSNAILRYYNHGLNYWRYPYDSNDRYTPFAEDGFGPEETISGETVYGLRYERELNRYGAAWKIAPIVFVAKVTQFNMSRMTDIVLILLSLVGIGLLRRWDLGVLFVGCFLAKTAFGMFMHVLVRYFDWANVPMLLGLAVFLYCGVALLADVARRRLPDAPASVERPS